MTLALVQSIPPLLEYIPKISPEFKPPYHMAKWLAVFERIARGEPVRALCTLPIRHYKTESTLHAVLWLLEHDPTLEIVLMTFSHERAMWLGKRLRVLAKRTKVGPTRGDDTITSWHNERGGGVVVMSADMSREGYNCHVLLVDDPIDEHGILAKEKRDAVDQSITHYTARCMRGGKPGPVLIVASRFDRDDPVGRRLARLGGTWEIIHEPAIYDLDLPTVRAFAPNVWDVPELLSIRAELKETDPYERTWWSRFMGDPRPVGGDVGPGQRYTALPAFPGFRDAIGFDLSFTKNRRSDWSAIVVGRVMYDILYVREIHRFRAELPEAIASIKNAWDLYGRCPVYSFMSGPEVSVAKMMAQAQMPIQYMKASAPKFVRARRTIDAHNAGRVLYPEHNPTIAGTLARLQNFKGVEDDEDDEMDALVSLWEGAVFGGNVPLPRKVGAWTF